MTGRLAEIEARIGTVHKLGAVIGAMRGIATARVQEARTHTEAIQAYAGTIGEAIAETLALLPPGQAPAPNHRPDTRHAVILITAEQGFVGTYNEQVFDAAAPVLGPTHDLLLVGERGVLLAAAKQHPVHWNSAMIAHPAQAVSLVTKMTDALFSMIASVGHKRVSIVHAIPANGGGIKVVTRQLVPFDYARFPPRGRPASPRINMAPDRLLARLAEEYIVAELIEAVMLAFAAENIARMRAMVSAHDNVTETLDTLVTTSRRIRQEEITDEIVELAVGHTRS